jgi:hypothetical protein
MKLRVLDLGGLPAWLDLHPPKNENGCIITLNDFMEEL